jgi:hypothetical protein
MKNDTRRASGQIGSSAAKAKAKARRTNFRKLSAMEQQALTVIVPSANSLRGMTTELYAHLDPEVFG